MKLLKLLRDKVRTDWIEFITYKREQWTIKRETRNLNRAINKAREWNLQDSKTYYILRAGDGQIYAMNRDTIKQFERMKMLPMMDMIERLEKSMSIVTSNQGIQEQYTQIKLRMEKTDIIPTPKESTVYRQKKDIRAILLVAFVLLAVIGTILYVNYKDWRVENPDAPASAFIINVK